MQIYSRSIEGVDIESSFLTLNNNVARIVKSLLDLQDGGKRQMTMKCRAVSTDYSRLFAVAFWCARATVRAENAHVDHMVTHKTYARKTRSLPPTHKSMQFCDFNETNIFLRLYYLFFLHAFHVRTKKIHFFK